LQEAQLSTENTDQKINDTEMQGRVCAKANKDIKEVEEQLDSQLGDKQFLIEKLNSTHEVITKFKCEKT
jgi:hypothetical protein